MRVEQIEHDAQCPNLPQRDISKKYNIDSLRSRGLNMASKQCFHNFMIFHRIAKNRQMGTREPRETIGCPSDGQHVCEIDEKSEQELEYFHDE